MVKRLSGEREGQGNSEEPFRRKRMARKWWRDFQKKEKGKEMMKGLPEEREGQGNGEETFRRKRRARKW